MSPRAAPAQIRGGRAMTRARLAWTIAGLDLVLFLISSLYPSDGGMAASILYLVGLGSFTVVGAVLIARVPENPIGILLLGAGTVLVIAIVIGTYANLGATQVPPWPWSDLARIVGDVMFVYPFVIAFIGVPLLFPDGRLPSPRFRWVVGTTAAGMAAGTLLGLLFDSSGRPRIAGTAFLAPAAGLLQLLFFLSILVGMGGAVVAVSQRYRRGDRVQRQQVKWLTADVALAAILLPPAVLLTDVNPELASTLSGAAIIAMFALPIVIGIAILRYRLYEIDRLISRTIGWAVVTGVLIAVFVGLVVALQALLAPFTNENTIAVAASTLVAFALFQPLRRRVQRAVDRRFNRAGYDAQRTTEAFVARLRHETDPGGALVALMTTASTAVRPRSAAVWLRGPAK
jgi:hypothetical protein